MSFRSEFFHTQNWYPVLSLYTLPVHFVKLRYEAMSLLASGVDIADLNDPEKTEKRLKLDVSREAIAEIDAHIGDLPWQRFVTTDVCAPTDTDRFNSNKAGAVHSAKSIWSILLQSRKVAEAAQFGQANYVCLRPFRTFNRPREFRLFIYDGILVGMSQYHLDRHYERLEGRREAYWKIAEEFVDKIIWSLPIKTLTLDIYITSKSQVLVVDPNPWGGDTDPLLFQTWERDWSEVAGIKLMDAPTSIGGEVSVSF